MSDEDSAALVGLVLLVALMQYVVVFIVLAGAIGFLGFGVRRGVRVWRRSRLARINLREVQRQEQHLALRRSKAIHDIVAIRQAAEQRMRRIIDGDVIEAESWEEK
jgi:hypothetical protein